MHNIFCAACFTACNQPSPDHYFGIAVLNSNIFYNFAGATLPYELKSPSARAAKEKGKFEQLKRKEVIDSKIIWLEGNFKKLKDLTETADAKNMLQASRAVYEYILPVYKKEYQQLAQLYDSGAPKEEIEVMGHYINTTYYPRFEELYSKLIAEGKTYAERHSINVKWGGF